MFSVRFTDQLLPQLNKLIIERDIRLLPREESKEVGVGSEANPVVALIEDGSLSLQESPGGGKCSVLNIKDR